MTVVGIANCGYCGTGFLARDERVTTEIEGYPIVREAGECPYCAAPTAHPDTFVLETRPDAIPVGGGR